MYCTKRQRWRTYVAAGNISVSIKLNYILMKLFVFLLCAMNFFFIIFIQFVSMQTAHSNIFQYWKSRGAVSIVHFRGIFSSQLSGSIESFSDRERARIRQDDQEISTMCVTFLAWKLEVFIKANKLIDVTVHSVPFCFQDI